jgi:hypothetical protein
MLQYYQEHRGLVDSTILLAVAFYLPFRVVAVVGKQQRTHAVKPGESPAPQHPLVADADLIGAIGTGILWTMLINKGPSLSQLWHGAGHVSRWLEVMLYTSAWLRMSRVKVHPPGRPYACSAVLIRAIMYGLFFLPALMFLNDW